MKKEAKNHPLIYTTNRLSINEFAEYAGIPRTTVYYYIKNKELETFISKGVQYISLAKAVDFVNNFKKDEK